MKNIQKGFTLIELMIVIAIIGILAAVALPAYNDYIERSKLSTGVAAMQSLKNAITDCFTNTSDLTVCDSADPTALRVYRVTDDIAGGNDGDTMAGIDALATVDGVITMDSTAVDTGANNLVIVFTPTTQLSGTQLKWEMTGTGCQDDAAGSARSIRCNK